MQLEWLALIIPCSYILISTFFLLFPNILHKRMRYSYELFNNLINSNKILCIGHRGGSWQGPQNTIQIFKSKQNLQHMFQLDVCLTKDKKLVVHHDASLHRLTGKSQLITQTNYNQICPYLNKIQALGGCIVQTSNNKVPLLEQVFSQFPEKPMNIQLKTPTDDAMIQYNRLVTKFSRQHITIWGIAGAKNQQLRNTNLQVVNFYSAGQILKIYLLFLTGLLPFVCIRQGVVDIPLATQSFYKMIKSFTSDSCFKSCLGSLLYQILNCFNLFSRLWIPHLKKRGILTFYFILNTQQDFQTAVSMGCSGIMTDLPTKLNKWLKQKNLFYHQQDSI